MRGICGRTRDEVFTADGFYPTGDLGYLDPDGYLFFVGRRDDMFKVKGATVYPSEVEAALQSIPAVQRAVVVDLGVSPALRVGALVVLQPGARGRRRGSATARPRRGSARSRCRPPGRSSTPTTSRCSPAARSTRPVSSASWTPSAPPRRDLDIFLATDDSFTPREGDGNATRRQGGARHRRDAWHRPRHRRDAGPRGGGGCVHRALGGQGPRGRAGRARPRRASALHPRRQRDRVGSGGCGRHRRSRSSGASRRW